MYDCGQDIAKQSDLLQRPLRPGLIRVNARPARGVSKKTRTARTGEAASGRVAWW